MLLLRVSAVSILVALVSTESESEDLSVKKEPTLNLGPLVPVIQLENPGERIDSEIVFSKTKDLQCPEGFLVFNTESMEGPCKSVLVATNFKRGKDLFLDDSNLDFLTLGKTSQTTYPELGILTSNYNDHAYLRNMFKPILGMKEATAESFYKTIKRLIETKHKAQDTYDLEQRDGLILGSNLYKALSSASFMMIFGMLPDEEEELMALAILETARQLGKRFQEPELGSKVYSKSDEKSNPNTSLQAKSLVDLIKPSIYRKKLSKERVASIKVYFFHNFRVRLSLYQAQQQTTLANLPKLQLSSCLFSPDYNTLSATLFARNLTR